MQFERISPVTNTPASSAQAMTVDEARAVAARGLRVARRIRSGMCHVNGPTVHDEAQMSFGGKAGIDQFTELRWITVETQPGHYPI